MINLLRAPETIQRSFPQCTSGINPADVYVAVHASTRDLPLYVASAARAAQGLLPHDGIMNCKRNLYSRIGMALWIAIVIHIIGVEFYVRSNKFNSPPSDYTACRSSKQTPLTKSGSISRWNPVISLRIEF